MSTHSLPLPSTTYPPAPSTTNNLNATQRTRLLKSTRKLGAVLGTTPFLLSPPPAPISIPSSAPAQGYREPPTPRTKKSRRTGRVFTPTSTPSYSSCTSSEGEAEDGREGEEGYVFVHHGGATGYHYHHLDISLPSNHEREAIKISLVPSSPGSKPKKTKKGGKALPPPLLLRLRAVPVPSGDPRVRDSVLSTHTTSIKSKSPLSPTFASPSAQSQTDTQKRKKLSKLSRTFGEPVPPELVFPPRTASPSAELLRKQVEKPQGPRLSARERRVRREGKKRAVDYDVEEEVKVVVTKERERARSGSISHSSRRAPRPRSLTLLPPLPPLPSLPALSTLPDAPRRSYDSSSEEEIETPPTSTDDLPESLKNYLSPPFSTQNPTSRTPPSPTKHAYSLSAPARPRTTSSGNSRTSEDKTHHRMHTHARSRTFGDVSSPCEEEGEGENEEEYGHRREREWSGEWNVRVGDVRRMLRELKAR